VLGEVIDEDLVGGAGVLEQPVVGRQGDLEGVLVLILLPRDQARGPGARIGGWKEPKIFVKLRKPPLC